VSVAVPRERTQDGVTAIRPLEASDLPALVESRLRNRAFLTEWEPDRAESFFTPAGQARELALDDAAWRTATGFPFAILDAAQDDRLIGRVALANVVRGVWQNATLGYWVSADAGSRGHATAAVGLVLRFAFEVAGLHRIQPAIMPRNVRSRRVVEKCGFRHEGVALRYLRINGVWEDHDLYAMTVEDWRDLRAQ
jgi:[ribosomal protein S5]-alanine N-acetyltransferase